MGQVCRLNSGHSQIADCRWDLYDNVWTDSQSQSDLLVPHAHTLLDLTLPSSTTTAASNYASIGYVDPPSFWATENASLMRGNP